MRAQVLAQAAAIDAEQLWIERLKVATTPPEIPQSSGESHEAIAELQAIFSEAGQDIEFLERLQEQLRPFLNKISDDLKDDVPLLDLARQKGFADIVQEVAPALLAQLRSEVP
jgi:hypothetical protein